MLNQNILYRAHATGDHEGSATSSDDVLNIQLSTARELGGAGGPDTNPEHMFAAEYSACFLGALKFVANQDKLKQSDSTSATGTVGIGSIFACFGIEIELQISVSGLPREQAQALVERAHVVCPYSNAPATTSMCA